MDDGDQQQAAGAGSERGSQGRSGGRSGRRLTVYSGGRKRKVKGEDVPLEALQRRGEGAGMPMAMLERGDPGTVRRVRHDGAMASALGRLIWAFDGLGRRRRRLVDYGPQAGRETLVSDGMELGALAYQRLWFAWHRMSGLPIRSVQAMDLSAIKVDCGSGQEQGGEVREAIDEARLIRLTKQLQEVEGALDRCAAPQLVRKVIETVVIDDVFVPLLLERPVALEAFRCGLKVLEEVLVRRGGKRER